MQSGVPWYFKSIEQSLAPNQMFGNTKPEERSQIKVSKQRKIKQMEIRFGHNSLED
jgi:hypothetical protein